MKTFLTFIILSTSISYYGQNEPNIQTILVDDSFDSLSLARLNEAIDLIKTALSSNEFRTMVQNESFDVGNYNLDGKDIYELIMGGHDNYQNSEKDSIITFRVSVFNKPYNRRCTNLGVTNMETRITRTHRCFIWNNDVKCYASHLMHEYMHQIGFYDKRRYRIVGSQKYSVPYKIGDIIDDIIGNENKCLAQCKTCKNE